MSVQKYEPREVESGERHHRPLGGDPSRPGSRKVGRRRRGPAAPLLPVLRAARRGAHEGADPGHMDICGNPATLQYCDPISSSVARFLYSKLYDSGGPGVQGDQEDLGQGEAGDKTNAQD